MIILYSFFLCLHVYIILSQLWGRIGGGRIRLKDLDIEWFRIHCDEDITLIVMAQFSLQNAHFDFQSSLPNNIIGVRTIYFFQSEKPSQDEPSQSPAHAPSTSPLTTDSAQFTGIRIYHRFLCVALITVRRFCSRHPVGM